MSLNRRMIFAAAGGALAAPALVSGARAQTAPAAAPAQAPGWYRFKLGSFTVTTVHDGFAQRPLEGFVANKPAEEVRRAFADAFLPTDTLTIPFTVTVVDTGRALVVIDTGNGPGRIPTAGTFLANMRGRA